MLPGPLKDPRVSAVLRAPLVAEASRAGGTGALLAHATRESGLRIAAAMEHLVEGPQGLRCSSEAEPDLARTTVGCRLSPGQSLQLVKLVAYGWSSRRSLPAIRDQVAAAIEGARFEGWEGLVAAQRPTWTRSGMVPTSSWTATPRCNRRSASPCSTCSRPARGPRRGRSRPRASPDPGTTGTCSGIPIATAMVTPSSNCGITVNR
jgi:hypothetical protein